MNWETVIAAFITALFAFLGVYMSNRKQTAVFELRLKLLEDKVGKHNNLEGRVITLETQVKDMKETKK